MSWLFVYGVTTCILSVFDFVNAFVDFDLLLNASVSRFRSPVCSRQRLLAIRTCPNRSKVQIFFKSSRRFFRKVNEEVDLLMIYSRLIAIS